MSLPLKNIRLLDFTHLLPGELCSTFLTDLGADVIRVEPLTPGLASMLSPRIKGESLYYMSVHRNKRRIMLNLKKPAAIEIVHKLVRKADVVLENFRPGVMERLGIDGPRLLAVNDKVVFCSISGYGHDSTYAERPGHDLNFIAESGLLALNSSADNVPRVPGFLISDYMTASYAALSITSALFDRQQTGKGRVMDVNMLDSAMSLLSVHATGHLYANQLPREVDASFREDLANYTVYRCSDGRYIAIAPLEPQFWQIFCDRISRPDLKNKMAFGKQPEMREELSKVFEKKSLADWMEIFEGSDCCVSPVNSVPEALDFRAADNHPLVRTIPHPTLGPVPQLRSPFPFQDERAMEPVDPIKSTLEILHELGCSNAEIDRLRQDEVIPPQAVACGS